VPAAVFAFPWTLMLPARCSGWPVLRELVVRLGRCGSWCARSLLRLPAAVCRRRLVRAGEDLRLRGGVVGPVDGRRVGPLRQGVPWLGIGSCQSPGRAGVLLGAAGFGAAFCRVCHSGSGIAGWAVSGWRPAPAAAAGAVRGGCSADSRALAGLPAVRRRAGWLSLEGRFAKGPKGA
jgi:hypothetical protein